ncbi:MAG: MarR family transcriptional regulator [Nitratireductor sp.]
MNEPFDLLQFLPFRLNRLAAEVSRRLHEIYGEPYGIDVAEWRVVATLGARGGATAQEIVRSTRTHKSTISRAVSHLMKLGWVERGRQAKDRRNLELQLTRLGAKMHDEIIPLVRAAEKDILLTLGKDTAQVLSAITRLEAALDIGGADDR